MDLTPIRYIYSNCSYLPRMSIWLWFLGIKINIWVSVSVRCMDLYSLPAAVLGAQQVVIAYKDIINFLNHRPGQ